MVYRDQSIPFSMNQFNQTRWGNKQYSQTCLYQPSLLLWKVISNRLLPVFPWPRHNLSRKGACRNVRFPHDYPGVSFRSWDKSKKPCPCGNHTLPNSVHHQNLESTQPVASCFPGPHDAPHWKMFDFHMGMHGFLLYQRSSLTQVWLSSWIFL